VGVLGCGRKCARRRWQRRPFSLQEAGQQATTVLVASGGGAVWRGARVRMEEESLKFTKSLNVLIGNNLRSETIMANKIHLNI
jgi:hypothetical protein